MSAIPTVVSVTGNDTFTIGSRVLVDFADGSNSELKFDGDIMNVKTGKNGNALFAANAMGLQGTVTLRIIRGSDDDNYLNSQMAQQIADPAAFDLLDGQLIKRVGDGNGNVTNDTYLLSWGAFVKQVEAASNAEGDTEQSLSVYHMKFAQVQRALF